MRKLFGYLFRFKAGLLFLTVAHFTHLLFDFLDILDEGMAFKGEIKSEKIFQQELTKTFATAKEAARVS